VDSGKEAFIESLIQRNSQLRKEEDGISTAAENASDDDVSHSKPARQLVRLPMTHSTRLVCIQEVLWWSNASCGSVSRS
jgi:hypothetical protein